MWSFVVQLKGASIAWRNLRQARLRRSEGGASQGQLNKMFDSKYLHSLFTWVHPLPARCWLKQESISNERRED